MTKSALAWWHSSVFLWLMKFQGGDWRNCVPSGGKTTLERTTLYFGGEKEGGQRVLDPKAFPITFSSHRSASKAPYLWCCLISLNKTVGFPSKTLYGEEDSPGPWVNLDSPAPSPSDWAPLQGGKVGKVILNCNQNVKCRSWRPNSWMIWAFSSLLPEHLLLWGEIS